MNLPIVSIVAPFFGLANSILRILKGNPKKGTTMETFGSSQGPNTKPESRLWKSAKATGAEMRLKLRSLAKEAMASVVESLV